MKLRLAAIAAAIAYATPAAATLPAFDTYSAAADFGNNFFTNDPTYTPLVDVTNTSGATAQIAGAGYITSASTTLGSNHAYASASAMPVLGAGNFSGWYDQVTITGGTGTGTAQFTVRLSGRVDVGQFEGGTAYGLYASSLHPTQIIDSLNILGTVPPPTRPWALDAPLGVGDNLALTTIVGYAVGASPYNDPTILFTTTPPSPVPQNGVIGANELPKTFANLVLTPGAGQVVDIVLTGTLNFTYGETFYLIGGLDAGVGGLDSFCQFQFSSNCANPVKDGTGATTLDFSNSANLVNIGLPVGATATFGSGATYNITAVPEPGAWLMLLAGLGLVGWRVRSRA